MRQKNKVLSLIIVLTMLLSTALTAFAQISDIDNHWAREEIGYMLDKGILKGYPDGTFKPNNNISKSEFYTVINGLMGYVEMADVGFKDVESTDWFYKEVAKGIKAGYLLDGEFLNPNDFITREEVARIIGFSFKLKENSQPASFFKDYILMSSSTIGFIGALKEKGYIAGFPDGNFGPQNNITRAEVVKMLYNILIAEGIPQKADLTAYKAALAAVKKADYTSKSWKAYQKIVDANEVTEENTQEEVDAATSAIKAAQKDLVKKVISSGGGSGGGYEPVKPPQKADLTSYNAALAAVNEDDYTPESWTAYQAVVEANRVTENDTQARVDAATAAIKAAQKNLVRIEEPIGVDKTRLVSAIEEATVYEEVYYTPETWEAFDIALDNAVVVRDNEEATQEEVDEALEALEAAIDALELIEPEDPEEPVEPAITNVQPAEDVILRAGDILEISFNALTGGEGYYRIMVPLDTAPMGMLSNNIGTPMSEESPGLYTAIWTVPGELEATGLQVEVVYISTEGARLSAIAEGKITVILEEDPVDPEPEADKTALEAAIAEAYELNPEDYTEESWADLQETLDNAIAVYDNEEATQEEVDRALTALQEAIDALELLVPVEEPRITAMYRPGTPIMPTFGYVSIEVENVEGAAKFDVLYRLSGGEEEATKIVNIGEEAGLVFYYPAQYNTVTIRIYDEDESLLHTFENVELVQPK